ncbi:MAG: murein L,D-transpeptidase, partial [Thermoleophilaceae bacterium]|nr:murein L,D-transpeptidase [Thermoleophilaceae bacterium]
ACALPGTSLAQDQPSGGGPAGGPVSAPTSVTEPPVKPAQVTAGRMSLEIRGGQSTRRLHYAARGAEVVVEGRSAPFVPGQVAVLSIYGRGGLVAERRAEIRQTARGGRASFRIKLDRRGLLSLVVRHAATEAQGAFQSRAARVKVIAPRAGQGARGTHVLLLQRGLARLGFAVPVTGRYDPGTSRAVLAFRKTNGLGRTGYASWRVFSPVLRNRGAFRPRFPRAGRHLEFDWSRQLLALVDGGRARHVYHASSGKASTPTVFGTFSFYRKEPGTNSLGMVQSNYFIGGYAIHGFASVPTYPASHGCIRVPIPNAHEIDRRISLGQKIFVYR